MSDVGKHLRKAREEYREVRYPGDLAEDVLGPATYRLGYAAGAGRDWRYWAKVGVAGALAATVALVAWTGRMEEVVAPAGGEKFVAFVEPTEPEFSVVPRLPEGEGLVPADVAIVPLGIEVPSFPSLESFSGSHSSEENT